VRIANIDDMEGKTITSPSGGHEMHIVISGNAQCHDGETVKDVKPGDSTVFEPFDPHWLVAEPEGASLFELLWP
jgi:mannose-6-phosphate isomerase-like protein (cupin superfamily)